MKKRLQSVAPLQLGIVSAVLYGIISLIIVPFLLLAAVFSHGQGGMGFLLIIFIPIIYAVLGFIGGVISGAVYNLVAGWTGGIEFTIVDVPQS